MEKRYFHEVHPELVKEWSPKNDTLTPEQVTYGSNKKVYWKGKCGHEWLMSVKSRSKGEGCPYCAGKRVLAGFNDIATKAPELAEEWSKKNTDVMPQQFTVGSSKKVWWKGKCGHEWMATIKNRISGSGCPYCNNMEILKGFNDLETLQPELAKDWSEKNAPLKPDQVMQFSNKKVWWKCHVCGYEWKALISSRGRGSKCECCSGGKIVTGINDLKTTQPELVKEWSELNVSVKPTEVRENAREVVWWTCADCGHNWKASVAVRVQGSGCPQCRRKRQTEEAVFKLKFRRDMEKLERNFEIEALRYYLNKSEIEAEFMNEDAIGVPIDVYLPAVKGAIIFSKKYHNNYHGYKMENAKNELCKKNNIRLVRIVEDGFKDFDNCAVITRMDDTLEAYDMAVDMALSMLGIKINIDTERDMRSIFLSYQNHLYSKIPCDGTK